MSLDENTCVSLGEVDGTQHYPGVSLFLVTLIISAVAPHYSFQWLRFPLHLYHLFLNESKWTQAGYVIANRSVTFLPPLVKYLLQCCTFIMP